MPPKSTYRKLLCTLLIHNIGMPHKVGSDYILCSAALLGVRWSLVVPMRLLVQHGGHGGRMHATISLGWFVRCILRSRGTHRVWERIGRLVGGIGRYKVCTLVRGEGNV